MGSCTSKPESQEHNLPEPKSKDNIRVKAQKIQENEKKTTLSRVTKEGYLTKLGRFGINWKLRWFVLYKTELIYYNSKEEMVLRKIVNLRDVIDVLADKSQGKENCFMVITSYRTFFMYASSAKEAEDWIKLLREKMAKVNRRRVTTKKRRFSASFGRSSAATSTSLTLREVQNELTEVVDWFPLGLQLGLGLPKLKQFQMDYPSDAQRCKTEVLDWWLRNSRECSWETLAEALKTMEYEVLAENLRRKMRRGTL